MALAKRLQACLYAGASFGFDRSAYLIEGRLPLCQDGRFDKDYAHVSFVVGPEWVDSIPRVECNEPWVRREDNWHAGSYGLCIEFEARWRDVLRQSVNTYGWHETVELAAAWIIHSTVNLLQRHLAGFRLGLTKWPSEWDFWPHGNAAALAMYHKEKQEAHGE